MLTNFITGILAYFRALGFITSRGLSKYFLYSGLIGLVIFAGSAMTIYKTAPLISELIQSIVPWNFELSTSIYSGLSIVLSSVLFLSLFKYLMLIFTAPLMSVLSERVESEITGTIYDKNIALSIIPELLRSLRINLRNMIREILLTLFILMIGLIPAISIVSGLLIILIQSYYAGFGNYDFWAERHFKYSDTIDFMKAHKGKLSGNGIVYVFLLAIPVLGAFIAPPLATVAATMEGTKVLEQLEI